MIVWSFGLTMPVSNVVRAGTSGVRWGSVSVTCQPEEVPPHPENHPQPGGEAHVLLEEARDVPLDHVVEGAGVEGCVTRRRAGGQPDSLLDVPEPHRRRVPADLNSEGGDGPDAPERGPVAVGGIEPPVDARIGLLDLVEVLLVAELEGEVVEQVEMGVDQVSREVQLVPLREAALQAQGEHLPLGVAPLGRIDRPEPVEVRRVELGQLYETLRDLSARAPFRPVDAAGDPEPGGRRPASWQRKTV
jgi:hypothetical protein